MESIFSPIPINPVNIAHSIFNENLPRFIVFFLMLFFLKNLPSSHVSCLILM